MDIPTSPPQIVNTCSNNRKKARTTKVTCLLKKPQVSVQPWISSHVWDNAPTIPLRFYTENPPRSSKNTGQRAQNHSSRSHGRNSDSSNRKKQLGGTQHAGPVKETVRNVWTAKDTAKTVNPPAPNQSNKSPAETVRSAWLNKFRSPTDCLN